MGGYEAEAAVADRRRRCPGLGGPLLGCDADEVAVTGSDTEGWTKALWGLSSGAGSRRARGSWSTGWPTTATTWAWSRCRRWPAPPSRRCRALGRHPRPRRAGRRAGRRRRGPGEPHPRRHPPGAGQPGGGGRRRCRRGRGAVLRRRLPERGPAAGRRAGHRLRRAPRPPAASGCAGRGAPDSSTSGRGSPTGSAHRHRRDARPPGTATTTTGSRTGRGGSCVFETPVGRPAGPRHGRRPRRWPSASDAMAAPGRVRWPRDCATTWSPSTGSRSTTAGRAGAGSSPSPSTAGADRGGRGAPGRRASTCR